MKKLNIFWLVLGILYLLYPRDLIPDFIFPFGYIDDFLILLTILYKISKISNNMPANGVLHFRKDEDFHGLKKKKRYERTPYDVLEVSPNASQEEIHKAYKTLMVQYHPDKVQHLGKDLQEVAKQKCLEISNAYAVISGKWPKKKKFAND